MKPLTQSHAAQRARERLGLELTRADVTEIWEKVDDGRAVFMGDRGGGVEAYAVTLNGKAMTVLLNPSRRVLVTIYERPGLVDAVELRATGARRDERKAAPKRRTRNVAVPEISDPRPDGWAQLRELHARLSAAAEPPIKPRRSIWASLSQMFQGRAA